MRAVALFCALAQAISGGGTPWGVDLAGRPVQQLAPGSARAVVLFFTATDCPIANRYIPEITHMAATHPAVHFWFVYPNGADTAQAVRAHRSRYAITGDALVDAHALTRLVHATVTPEAAVLVPEGKGVRVLYRGRIDDRYAALGRERPQAMHHDLEDALDAVLAGRPPAAPGGPPVGCSIVP